MPDDDPLATISTFTSGLTKAMIPDRAVEQVKLSILDTFGCGLHGSTIPTAQIVRSVLGGEGPTGRASVWGTATSLNAADAALANGTAAHSFELDDLHRASGLHVGSVTVPALVALAETTEVERVGDALIVALVAGCEVGARVGLCATRGVMERGFHVSGVIGAVTSAAACARFLRLDPEQTQDALGIAVSLAGGLMAAQYGSSVKRMHPGRAAQAGVYSARLAAQGLRGIRQAFDDRPGDYLEAFAAQADREALTAELGSRWETTALGFKPYAACAASHTSIDAILDILAAGVGKDDIAHVLIEGQTSMVEHVGWKYEPDTVTTAQMNVAYAVACTILDGRSTIEQFDEARLADPEVLAMIERIDVRVREAADGGPQVRNGAHVTVTTTDGQRHRAGYDYGLGTDARALGPAQVVEKFTGLAGRAIEAERADALVQAVTTLESLTEIDQLSTLLRP